MTLGDLTVAALGKVMRVEGLPPRVIVSVRHYRIDDPAAAGVYTSVIHRATNAKPGDPCGELRALSSTAVEVRG